jgi:hypothetical protein
MQVPQDHHLPRKNQNYPRKGLTWFFFLNGYSAGSEPSLTKVS